MSAGPLNSPCILAASGLKVIVSQSICGGIYSTESSPEPQYRKEPTDPPSRIG